MILNNKENKPILMNFTHFVVTLHLYQNSNSYNALNGKKLEMTAFRNQSIIGLLVLVIFGLLVF